MILNFLHKGLARFHASGNTAGIQPAHRKRLCLILTNLDVAAAPGDMDLPGLRLHQLKGVRRGTWSVSVSGNWRVTFCFVGKDVAQVNYEDYH